MVCFVVFFDFQNKPGHHLIDHDLAGFSFQWAGFSGIFFLGTGTAQKHHYKNLKRIRALVIV